MSRSESPTVRARVTVPYLNIRTSAESDAAVCGLLEQGTVISIIETAQTACKQWGRIKPSKQNGSGWIALDFTEKL